MSLTSSTAARPFEPAHVAALDGWRGLAIVAVLVGHFFPLPGINAGRFGVELFFVLSGRLMGDILFVKNEPLPRFYWRRFTRIYPTLLLFVAVCALLIPFGLQHGPTVKSALAAATLTINYLHSQGYGAAVFDHIWSLCVEEHTYVLLGLIAVFRQRMPERVYQLLLGLAVVTMASGAVQTLLFKHGYYDVYWRSDARGTGILLASGLHVWRSRCPQSAWVAGVGPRAIVGALVLAVLLSVYPVPDPVKYSVAVSLLAFAVVFVDRAPVWLLAVLRWRVLGALGIASFSLYLWQQPLYVLVKPHWGGLATCALALAIGLLSFRAFERPARRWLNRRGPKAALALGSQGRAAV